MAFLQSIRRIVLASYPELWTYTGFLFIFGALAAAKNGSTPSPYLFPYLVWFFPGANLFGMLLNDYFDQELDAHNPRKTTLRLSTGEYISGIAVALVSYAAIAVAFPNLQATVWVALAVAANIIYSTPPLRLKEHPPFDVLGGPASYLTAVFAGYALGGGGWPSPVAAVAGVLFFCGIDLAFKTLDIEADSRGGIRTSATKLGRRNALALSGVLLLGAGGLISLRHTLYSLAVLPYLCIIILLRTAHSDNARRTLDARLPAYYFAAGFVVTALFWIL